MAEAGKASAHFRSLLAAFNEVSERGEGKFRIQLLLAGEHLVLRIEGQVSIPHSQSLVDKVRPILVAAKAPKHLVVDLAHCDHLASSAIGFIAFVAMEMAKRGGIVYLVKASPKTVSMLKILGVDQMMKQVDDIDSVLPD